MTVDNEFAKRLFAAFAAASLLKAEHRECSAKLRALLTESEQIKAELRECKPRKLELVPCNDLSNSLQRVWLADGL
jgi:hypothetical protein